ncbi:MAG: DUF2752 domain-containing protein [Balneolaceae bacterium]
MFKYYFFLHFEWVALASGLLLMALLDPSDSASSLCPLDRIGFEFCPGEGLGRSIAYGFRGDFHSSLQAHPAGLPAIVIILGRIVSIFRRNRNLTN